jgi:multidrug efflux pump subunit AcrB
MLNRLIEWSLAHRGGVMGVSALVLVLGIFTAFRLPVEVLPDLTKPTVVILTEAPGLAPEEVETRVTQPIETALMGVAGLTRLRSNSDVSLSLVYDETDYINSAIGLVKDNILVGGLLTLGTLLLFLRNIRSTLIVAMSIPVSVMGTFLALAAFDRTLNVISLAGIAFAVGMLIDNSVVVLENIFVHWSAGESPKDAAVKGTQEVWGAILASTLTNVAVFLPVLFVEGEVGQLFGDIALAIAAAVGLSIAVSGLVVPAAAALLLQSRHARAAATVVTGAGETAGTTASRGDVLTRFGAACASIGAAVPCIGALIACRSAPALRGTLRG